ncbi:hypothetical protein Tco_1013744 [Tanacetum coccineum]
MMMIEVDGCLLEEVHSVVRQAVRGDEGGSVMVAAVGRQPEEVEARAASGSGRSGLDLSLLYHFCGSPENSAWKSSAVFRPAQGRWPGRQTSASTPVVAKMHKEDQQAIGNPKYLGVTGEERANPRLSSRYDASADSTAKADPALSAPNDSIHQQQGMDEGTKNTSFDHISAGKGSNSIDRQVDEEEASKTVKLEDITKLVSHVQPSFKDMDSPVDDPIIVVDDSDEDEE